MKLTKNIIISGKQFQQLPSKVLLRGGRVVDPEQGIDEQLDVVIEDGTITALGKIKATQFEGEIIDVTGKVVSPGWMDMHVHLREPGREDEETIESGTLAAANGGFVAVCCMPNTNPPIDTQEIIQYIKDRAKNSLVDVYPIAAISKKREGKELAEILELVEQGAVAISDDGSPVMNAELMRRALEYAKMAGIPVIGHEEDITMTEGGQINEGFYSTRLGLGAWPTVAEDIMIIRDILLTEYTGGQFHVAHISSGKAVELVRNARKQGIQVTAEVTPHHFSLTEEAVMEFDTNTKMNPPLRSEADRQALIEGLKDDTISVIATDHAPHAFEEKEAEYIYAPFGIVGLETALGLMMTNLVHAGHLTLAEVLKKVCVNPYKILHMETPLIQKGKPASVTVFDLNEEWQVDASRFQSKSANSPFIGQKLKGKPHLVIHNNKIFYSTL